MIQSQLMAGVVIESALKRAGMLAHHKWGLSIENLLGLLNQSVREEAKRNFETDKEDFYDTRPVITVTNGKYATGYPSNVGTGTVSSAGTALTGAGTLFLTELVAGEYIYAGGQLIQIASVTDDLNAVLTGAAVPNLPAGSPFYYGALPSYDATLSRITVTMTPAGSTRDIGKVITFFEGPVDGVAYAGKVINFLTTPDRYEVALFITPPSSLAWIKNIQVIDWLPTGNVIRLIGVNEIMSPENIELFDVTNNAVIDMVPYEEFNRRLKMLLYTTGSRWWARFRNNTVELSSGSTAPALGTCRISAYWVPLPSTDLDSAIYINDKRVPATEERLISKLLSVKMEQPIPQAPVNEKEQQEPHDRQTRSDLAKSR